MNIILKGILTSAGIFAVVVIIYLLIPGRFKKTKKFIKKVIEAITYAFP